MSPSDVGGIFDRVVDVHVELHSVDFRAVGLEDFGKPEGYVERQVAGWSDRYRRARTPDVPDCEGIMAWLEENRPPDSGPGCIVHNDFRLDNVVLDPTDPMRVVGVLDWEMATLGDPLMDLGASLAYWVEQGDPEGFQAMRMMPTNADGAPTRAEVVARYAAKSGLEVGDFSFYYCYGLFRLAGIVQQIYYRSYHGQTEDPRFQKPQPLGRWSGRSGAGGGGRCAMTDSNGVSSLFSIRDKIALVTGGSRGIGLMIARGYVEAGATVYISSRKAEVCDAVAEELSAVRTLRLVADRSLDHGGGRPPRAGDLRA